MSLEQKLQQIDELQEKIHAYGKLPDDVLKKINYKFRLEWNYTSNSMEGNSLTKSETRSVMIGNITVSGKPIKDVLEVKGHDEVISTIMKMGKGELNLSEKRIRDIHTGIMHEENPEKKAQIGQWKKDKNYLYNYKNERFDFVAPADVPERMHQLVNWVNAERDKITRQDKAALHPVMLALRFNLEYVTIHPFYDGNGRTSRILTNLILIAYGYPPLYIKENERNAYYQYLGDIQGYGGAPDVFFEYMAGLILRSQLIVLDAIEGKDIEDKDDYLKEIDLLKKRVATETLYKSPSFVYDVYEYYNGNLWSAVNKAGNRFNSFFSEQKTFTTINNGYEPKYEKRPYLETINPWHSMVSLAPMSKKILGYDVYETDVRSAEWKLTMFGLRGANTLTNYNIHLDLIFNDNTYSLAISLTESSKHINIISIEKNYGYLLDKEEILNIQELVERAVVDKIKADVDDSPNVIEEK
jgi:Fic family protein